MEEKRKKLEIITGNGSNLDISPVYEHINTSRPKSSEKKPTNIIVPNSITPKQNSNENTNQEIKEDSTDESFDDVTLSDESHDNIEEEEKIDNDDDFDDLFIEEDDEDNEDDDK